jgi:cytochrome b subunit of formate dehydrogenase
MEIATVDPAAPAAPAAGVAAGTTGLTQRYYRRFTASQRVLHVGLMLTFVGCALTGLPLLYAEEPWAATLARILGGFESAGVIHRICATVMILVFSSHVVLLLAKAIARGGVLPLLWGPDSLVPQPQDIVDIVGNFKWFVGAGPQPQFDRWTYWEKFDYWAVFWGMVIIGGSGLLLWFPVFFSQLLPGWMFNIAALVHGEEALLAVGFIFTFHFFNGHVRPAKFPMDTVIFTGRISENELKSERRVEYERLIREGRLAEKEAPAPTAESKWFGWIVGGAALVLGIVAIVLIVYSVF